MTKIGWSPSQQPNNQYAGGGEGFSDSEQYWMQLLAAECHKQWLEQRNGIPSILIESGSWMNNAAASNAAGVTHHVAQHTNSGGGIGCEVWANSDESVRMANVLFKHISAATDTTDRGVKVSSKYGELNSTKAVAVIVEYQFHDSLSGAEEIRNSIKEYATATVKGMCEYLGVQYRSEPADLSPRYAVVIFHADTSTVMDRICDARNKKFAGYPAPAGEKYQGALSYTDALNYIALHGSNVVSKFPDPDGEYSVGIIHCSPEYAAEVKAWCDDNIIACTSPIPVGGATNGYRNMTSALADCLTDGIDFPSVFGK